MKNLYKKKSKHAQEEIIGFALIIIIVAVILVIFLGFSLRNSQKELVESYEVESFIQTFLQYTTDCRNNLEYLSIQKLIFECNNNGKCLDGKDSCEVLNSTLKEIVGIGWGIGETAPTKAYELKINSGDNGIILIEEGNKTSNYKGSMQDFSRGGNLIEIRFIAYY